MSSDADAVVFEKLHEDVEAPSRATRESAGYDLRAYLSGRRVRVYRSRRDRTREEEPGEREGRARLALEPDDRALVPTGLRARLPSGYEAQIRIRSSLALERGLILPNAPGTIDADYPDEWFVLVQNASSHSQQIVHGERVAQAVLKRYETLEWVEGRVGRSTDREGGFGSTGD